MQFLVNFWPHCLPATTVFFTASITACRLSTSCIYSAQYISQTHRRFKVCLYTHETIFFCFSSVFNFPVITFSFLKQAVVFDSSGGNAGLKVITKNNNRLLGYYRK